MPMAPLTDHALAHPALARHRRYNAQRREQRGPDPRSTARWRRVRAQVLAAQPLCADPDGRHLALGQVVLASEVDHMQGIWRQPLDIYLPANLQPLCHACHARKSQLERGAAGVS